jgi:hypothetical protein
MSETDRSKRRELLKRAALLGGAGAAAAALIGGLDSGVLGAPSPSSSSVMNQWDMLLTASCIVFVDSGGSYYVKDAGIGPDLGALIVDASVITAYGASLGAGASGANTTTAGIQEAINCLSGGGSIVLAVGTYNISTGIYIGVNGITILGIERDACVINFTGNIANYHGIYAQYGITSATDNGAAVTTQLKGLHLENFSINLNSNLNSYNSNETSGCCVKAVASLNALIARLNVYGMADYGIYLKAGLAKGGATSLSANNVVRDCLATVDGVIGFFSDSGFAIGTVGDHNSAPNRGQLFSNCVAVCPGLITATAYNPTGFSTWGEIGTAFVECVAQGFLGNSLNTNVGNGFMVQGIGMGTTFDSCLAVENDFGIALQSAIGISIVNHTSWFNRQAGIGNQGGASEYGVNNLQIKNLICMDEGGTAHEGAGVRLQNAATLNPNYVDIDGMRAFMTGLKSPIYNNSPMAFFQPIKVINGSHWRVRGVDALQLVGLGAALLTVGGTNSDIILRDCPGFNPVNKVINAFGTGLVGFGGSAAVPAPSTDYVVIYSDIFITSANSSNNDNSITIKDGAGNVVQSGLSTLTALYVPAGYKINWGAFTGTAGAVTLWGV